MRTLSRAFFLVGSLSLFAACNVEEDSLGKKGNNQNAACEGPDPSTLGCTDSSTCPSGMVCDPNACHSSSCSCDDASGNWQCTADCGLGACVPDDVSKCEGPDPSTLGCTDSSTCPSGMVCDPSACHSSSCSCDEQTGNWQCTADCGLGACVPEDGAKCEGPDPSDGCEGGCATGTVCDPNACRPSACGCDPASGSWLCTADCGEGGACVPDDQKQCPGANPADGCDNGCPSGTVCDPNACNPSLCSCDTVTGSWLCTADCGNGGACVPI
jgi:hypothetical protein